MSMVILTVGSPHQGIYLARAFTIPFSAAVREKIFPRRHRKPIATYACRGAATGGAGKYRDSLWGRWAVEVLARPFVRLWEWFEHVGGLPGQIFLCCAVVLGVLGIATWLGNKR
jgi:hypothetical protein